MGFLNRDDDDVEENADGPEVSVDYRVFEVTASGGDGDSVEDVNEIVEERIEQALDDIEDLKRTDYNLEDEFDVDRDAPQGKQGHYQ